MDEIKLVAYLIASRIGVLLKNAELMTEGDSERLSVEERIRFAN